MHTSFTPAILAGMASISTVEGYAAVPPGTYRPARSTGITFCPITTPGVSLMRKELRTCREWNLRMFAAARSRTPMNSGATEAIAPSVSSLVTARLVRDAPSNLFVYLNSASSPRARTSAMMAATVSATFAAGTARAKISSFLTSPYFSILIIGLPP